MNVWASDLWIGVPSTHHHGHGAIGIAELTVEARKNFAYLTFKALVRRCEKECFQALHSCSRTPKQLLFGSPQYLSVPCDRRIISSELHGAYQIRPRTWPVSLLAEALGQTQRQTGCKWKGADAEKLFVRGMPNRTSLVNVAPHP